ncbi:MAG: C4-type zinc ribbon domain-containing protein [Bacteroidaceae bacterium]|nr:C4-type zinc ribbon domain-containing protein [Prevotellaceae bacterium]MDY3063100.1 C4-type zinc ribbon domain-containing protein [Bacteroidaceae bacterium]
MAKEIRKTVGSEITVEQKLKSLYKYQTVLSKIDEIRILRGELPLEVQDLEDEIEGLGARVTRIQEELQKACSDINKCNEEKRQAQAAIERCQSHIDNVRNSREYDALSKEIEFQELEIQLRDKRIKEANEIKANCEKNLQRSIEQRDERISDLDAKKSELEEIVTETKAEEENLRDEAKILEATLDYRLLSSFKRIRKNSHNGLGIVCVQRDACGGCFNKIPPQRQLDVRMHKKVIVCEYCGRILIDPELAGIQVVHQEEEEKKPRRRRLSKKAE